MINIPDRIYAAADNRAPISNSLVEMIVFPVGETATEASKHKKVSAGVSVISEYDNRPLPGFTLHKVGRKTWAASSQSWQIIDPRGFLIRITNENLEAILHVTGITEGLIQEKCVWARHDNRTDMTLLPISSPDYIEATDNTSLIENKVSLTDVQVGDTVLLQNKLIGKYMGVLTLYGLLNHNYTIGGLKVTVFRRRQVIKLDSGMYYFQPDAKILKVLNSGNTMTQKEACELINCDIDSGKSEFSPHTSPLKSTEYIIRRVAVNHGAKVTIKLEEIDREEFTRIFDMSNAGGNEAVEGRLVVEDSDGGHFVPYLSWVHHAIPATVDNFDVRGVDITTLSGSTIKYGVNYENNKYNFGLRACNSINEYVKFYKIIKCVKNNNYL